MAEKRDAMTSKSIVQMLAIGFLVSMVALGLAASVGTANRFIRAQLKPCATSSGEK